MSALQQLPPGRIDWGSGITLPQPTSMEDWEAEDRRRMALAALGAEGLPEPDPTLLIEEDPDPLSANEAIMPGLYGVEEQAAIEAARRDQAMANAVAMDESTPPDQLEPWTEEDDYAPLPAVQPAPTPEVRRAIAVASPSPTPAAAAVPTTESFTLQSLPAGMPDFWEQGRWREPTMGEAAGETLDAITRAFNRGWLMDDLAGEMEAEKPNAERVVAIQREMHKNGPSSEFQRAMDDRATPQQSWEAFKAAPVRVVGELTVESLTAYAKQMLEKAPARVAIGAGLGGGTALAAGQAGPQVFLPEEVVTVPAGMAIGAQAGFAQASGASSMALEMSGGILEALEKAGVNMANPEELQKALNDPERMQLARDFAQKKAIPVAAFDTVSALIAGRLIGAKPASVLAKIGEGVVETAVQAFLGAGGEAAGQLAQTGEIQSGRQILAEGVGEFGPGVGEIAVGATSMAIQNRGKNLPTGGRVAFEEAMPAGQQGPEASGVASPWQAARDGVAPVRVEVVDDGVFGEPTTAAVPEGDERFAPPQPQAQPVNFAMADDSGTMPAPDMGADVFAGVPQQQAPAPVPTGPLEQAELMSVPRQLPPAMEVLRSRLDVVDAELNDLAVKPERTSEDEDRWDLLIRQRDIFERALTRREQAEIVPRQTAEPVVEGPQDAPPSLVDYAKQKLTQQGKPTLAEAITSDKAAQSFRAQYERDFPQAAKQPAVPADLQSMGQGAPEPEAPVTIEDFGEEIPEARKHRATPLGPRGYTITKEEDERPAWLRKYIAGKRLYTSRTAPRPELIGQETGTWTLMRTDGAPIRSMVRSDFATEEEAMAAVPMVEVSRNHMVRSRTNAAGEREYAIVRRISDRKMPVVKGGFETQQEAEAYMAANPAEIIEYKLPIPQRPWLDSLERVGGTERKGNVTPKMFQETFGFRGGQFGNWNMGGDGQEALNFAYDALLDLADILQVPPKALSLDGELAIAFGARGSGGIRSAAAHYEPDFRVINLTKINGAGSLAHEWFHAIDHYLGQQDEEMAKFKSGKAKLYASYGLFSKAALPNVLRERFKAMMDSLTVSNREIPLSQTAEQDKQTRVVANMQQDLTRLRNSMAQYAEFRKRPAPTAKQLAEFDALAEKLQTGQPGAKTYITPKNARRMSLGYESYEVIDQLNALYKKVTGASFLRADSNSSGRQLVWSVDNLQRVMERVEGAQASQTERRKMVTDFLKESRRIDQNRVSNYWSEPEEMGARAFESFVADKLAASERRNDYLVSGVDNRAYALTGFKPYPEGEERQAINAAWQDVWDAVRETAPDLKRATLRKSIAAKLSNMSAQSGAIDLSIVEDLAQYGRAAYWAGMSYAQWAGRMVRDFGQAVGQFLRQAFDRIVAAYKDSPYSDTTGAVGDVRPKSKPRQMEEKARANEGLAPETRERLGSQYIPISLNAEATEAKDWINTNGLEAAKARIAALAGDDTVPTPLDFAIGIEAAGRLSATGDHAGAAAVVGTMSRRATSMGQTVAVLAMMARLTPEGIVLYGENLVRRYVDTLPAEAQERIKALQAEVERLRATLSEMKFKEGSEVIRSGKLGDEKIQDRLKRRVKARVQADLGPAASGPEVTAETKARTQGLNRKVRDVLLSDSKRAEMTAEITRLLQAEGNMSPAEAEAVAKSIVNAFTKIVGETRRKYVEGAKRASGGLRKGNFDKLLRMLTEQKDMSDAEFLGQVSRLMGLPGMTAEMARELKALGERFESTTDPDLKQVFGAMMFEKAHEIVPVDFWVKVRGFSYLSMLFAPKTWIRNLGGNQVQWIADVGLDAAVTSVMDPMMSIFTGKRTSVGINLGARLKGLAAPIADVRKGYFWSKQHNPAFNWWQNVRTGLNHLRLLSKLTTQNKFEIADVHNVGGRIFSSKFMRMWDAGLSIALGAGDRAFWMSAFRASLAKMERAAIANGEWTGQPTPVMIEAAMADAAYAIYQNPNVLSRTAGEVRGWINYGTTGGRTKQFGLGTALLAFTQVPGSIALRGLVEWSPVGLINSFYQGMRGILYATSDGRVGKKFDQAAFNKAFTQAIIGSGIYASGFWLYSIGVLTASMEDDDDLEAMRRASGMGAYRINMTALYRALTTGNWFTRQAPQDGDLIMAYDWIQPVAITVAAGAEYAAMLERAERNAVKKGLAERASMPLMSLVAGAKSLEELPLLSGLMSFMGTMGRKVPEGESKVANAIVGTVTGMPSMFVPQLVRQAMQLGDNMMRTTRAGRAEQREFDRLMASIPGWSTKYPVRFDIAGQAMERYQYGENTVFNVLINPALTRRYKADPVLQEIGRLLNATGEKGVIPREVDRKAKINGVDVELTNQQIAAYQYYVGNFTMSHFRWRMAAPVYARLPDEVKAKMLAQDLTDIHAAVKSAVLGADPRRLTRTQMYLRQALVNSPLGQSVPPK